MSRKHYLLFMAVALLLSACHKKAAFTVEGTIADANGNAMYIEELTPDGPVFLDSIKPDAEGHFKWSHELPYPTFYNLHCTATDYIVLLPLEKERIVIEGTFKNLQRTYKTSGSHETELLWQLQDYTNHGIDELIEILKIDNANREKYGKDVILTNF